MILGVAVLLLTVALFFKYPRHKKSNSLENEAEPTIQGTTAEREAAEQALQLSDQQIRAEILKTHVLIERLPTLDGFTQEYLDDLVKEFDDAGISATYFFQAVAPLGVMSMVKPQGVYELYADKSHGEQASKLLDQRLQRS
ncbi:MAG: hypothetical protein V4692_14970 [Bdellovibrionota bacterium]